MAVDGYMYGDTITYTASTLNIPDGFTVGDTLTYGGTTQIILQLVLAQTSNSVQLQQLTPRTSRRRYGCV